MTSDAAPLPRTARHGFAAPTAGDAQRLVTRAAAAAGTDAEDAWDRVCAASGVPAGALDLDQLDALAAAMTAEAGPLGVAGHDFQVRVRTYRALSAVAGEDDGHRPYDAGRRLSEQLLTTRVPDDERMVEIASLDLFSAENRQALDTAARRAAEHFAVPMGLVTVVTDTAQSFAGSHGVQGWAADAEGTPVEWSFCAVSVRTQEPYVVADAAADVLQRHNPLVEADGLASYAGVPLITSAGHAIGSLCLLDAAARDYTPADIEDLRGMAAAVVRDVEDRRASVRHRAA